MKALRLAAASTSKKKAECRGTLLLSIVPVSVAQAAISSYGSLRNVIGSNYQRLLQKD
ncbi:hypothetical protein [Paenibacillus prosopidis]|uniref:hypothetical protein n=1 Tax=Paenibacillus prosopidis TaxID=630520 RepID=UPI0015F1A7AA|nr:hypothetical protein [Paenibacillus prosopidis]